jgi:hypothetical protein
MPTLRDDEIQTLSAGADQPKLHADADDTNSTDADADDTDAS